MTTKAERLVGAVYFTGLTGILLIALYHVIFEQETVGIPLTLYLAGACYLLLVLAVILAHRARGDQGTTSPVLGATYTILVAALLFILPIFA